MKTTIVEQSGVTVVEVEGRMDAGNSQQFEKICKEQLAAGAHSLVIDFAGVEYTSSAGLRGILVVAKAAKAQKTSLAICALQPQVNEVFTISGFMNILAIHGTRQEAIDAMTS